jgi:hypothetical protein
MLTVKSRANLVINIREKDSKGTCQVLLDQVDMELVLQDFFTKDVFRINQLHIVRRVCS